MKKFFSKVRLLAFILLFAIAVLLVYVKVLNSHEHTFSDEWTLLIEDGKEKNTCDECGKEIVRELTVQHVHSFSKDWTVISSPTIKTEGEECNVCDSCGVEVFRAIDKLHAHSFSKDWTAIIIPTEEENGREVNVCDVCNATVSRTLKYCEEHIFATDWTQNKKPTIRVEGSETNECVACGATVTREIPKLEPTKILLTTPPSTTYYFTGEYFSSTGMVVTAVLNNGSTQTVTATIGTNTALTADVTSVEIKYRDCTLSIPITVSPAIISSVEEAQNDHAEGQQLYLRATVIGSSTTPTGEKLNLLKDRVSGDTILLRGADYAYGLGNEIELYVTVASDSYGKYLVYSSENENPEDLITSVGSFTYSDYGNSDNLRINSSTEMDEVFESIERYDSVTFNGDFYVVKDGEDFIIHFNSSATDLTDVALENGKTVKLSAENATENKLFDLFPAGYSTSYPGVQFSGAVTALFLYEEEDTIYLEILDKDWVLDQNQVAIVELAYAYYYQLPQIDYDQYNTRRNINPAPEEATAQQRIYLDCSSYVNAIYYNAFGENIMPYTIAQKGANTSNFAEYAKDNVGTAVDLLGYWETKDYATREEKVELLKEIYNSLEVGDVIVYRKGAVSDPDGATSGHALIYVGNGLILHCMNTGSYEHNKNHNPLESYDQISLTSIGFESCANLFENESEQRYLAKFPVVAIFRPTNRGLVLTSQTEARLTVPGLSIEKSVDVNMYSAVFTGDTLTYTVTLKNNTLHDLENVLLSERVPLGTEFIEATEGITHNAGVIEWNGTVPAEETVTLTFSVRVTATDAGALIESDEGTVNGLNLNKITNTVSGISRDKLDELSDLGAEIADNETEYANPILMVNAVYNALLGENVLNYASVEEALADIINTTDRICNPDALAKDIVIANLSGGYLIKGSNPFHNERIRAIRIDYLTCGDVIIAEHANAQGQKIYTAYVYLGEVNFLAIESETGKASILRYNDSGLRVQDILTSLYSYDKYAIIRPSMDFVAE